MPSNCDNTYTRFGEVVRTHLRNKHLFSEVKITQFTADYASSTDTVNNTKVTHKCEYCSLEFQGKKWLDNLETLRLDAELKQACKEKRLRGIETPTCKKCFKRRTPKHKCKDKAAEPDSEANIFSNFFSGFSDSFFFRL